MFHSQLHTQRQSEFYSLKSGVRLVAEKLRLETVADFHLSEPPRLLPVTLPVTRQGTSKGHQEVNNKKAGNK